jgi:HPt (histidine-containing phosphotransfer) domain-containing protein
MPQSRPEHRDLSQALQQLWIQHRPLNEERIAALENAATALAAGTLTAAIRQQAEQEAHKLAGGAGSFGYSEITDLAREVELQLREAGPLDVRLFRAKLNALQRAFERTLR